jgi:hypothetical protein
MNGPMADFAAGLHQDFPASAAVFSGMRAEESTHHQAGAMEVEAEIFMNGQPRAQDVDVRQLLDDLAQEERSHEIERKQSRRISCTLILAAAKTTRRLSRPSAVRTHSWLGSQHPSERASAWVLRKRY